jgi:hypothetical protein
MPPSDWDPRRDLLLPLVIIAMVVVVAYLSGGAAIFNP